MSDKGKYIGDFEYGRCPYGGAYIGDFEFGRCPGIGYIYIPPPPPSKEILKGVELLQTKILKKRFWTADYPKLEPNLEGMAIPIAWGQIIGAPLFCIDTDQNIFKIIETQGRAIKAVDAVFDKNIQLVEGVDYEVDLANAKITIYKPPLIQPNMTYYFSIESDYPINGTDYLRFSQIPWVDEAYKRYDIDNNGMWTEVNWFLPARIYGRTSENSSEEIIFDSWSRSWEGWNNLAYLRKDNTNVRLGMRFQTPANGGPWYVTKIVLSFETVGSPPPDKKTRIKILSSISPSESQIGGKTFRMEDYSGSWGDAYFLFPQRTEVSDVRCNFRSVTDGSGNLIEKVADIIKDCYVNVMGGSESGLDLNAFNELGLARTESLSIYIKDEITFREFIDKLEVGQRFKFLPSLEQKFMVAYAKPSSQWPSNTIHFRDEDFLEGSFRCQRLWKAIYYKIKLKYMENPKTNEWQVKEISRDIARCGYRNEKTLTIETYLKNAADAENYANAYGSSLSQPPLIIEFKVMGAKGFELVPWQGIWVTKKRAVSITGSFEKKAFRVLSVQKNPLSGITSITAIENEPTI